jgi:hypothetical protein
VPFLCPDFFKTGVVGSRWHQGGNLAPRDYHRFMSRVQVVEFVDQPFRGHESFGLLKHEVPDEDIEIAEIFRRLRLVQQAEREFIRN